MVSTPEGFTDNSPIPPIQYVTVKNPSAIKPLFQFLYTLEVKTKTAVRRVCASTPSTSQSGLEFFCVAVFQRGWDIQKSTNRSKSSLQLDFTRYLGFAVPNSKWLSKMSIDVQVEPLLVPKRLLQVLVREIYIIMVIPPQEGGVKEAIDAYNNNNISYSTLHNKKFTPTK